jgi:hypothetical protein
MAHQTLAFPRFQLEGSGRRFVTVLLVVFSITTTVSGLAALVAFDNTPGAPASPPTAWPPATRLHREARRPELLVFAHPYCACTTATISELARLLASRASEQAPDITFVVYRPDKATAWSWKSLKDRASALPNSRFLWDNGGQEARRFGSTTSGMVLLYDTNSHLRFSGGITGSRGHEGDNYGLDALRAALATTVRGEPSQATAIARSRVYGCALGSVESDSSVEGLPAAFTGWLTTLGQNLNTIFHRNA